MRRRLLVAVIAATVVIPGTASASVPPTSAPAPITAEAIRAAKKPTEIDKLLADETYDALKLASAASFRREGPVFERNGNGKGWGRGETTRIEASAPILAAVPAGQ